MKTHTGLVEMIEGFAGQVKEIEQSPGPKSIVQKLYLQLNKERLEALLDASQRGAPLLDANGEFARLGRAMGFASPIYSITAEYAAASFRDHSAIVETMGFAADKLCDKIVSQLALRNVDTMPKPDVIIADSHGCDNDHKYYARMQGDLFGIPVFFLDIGLNADDKAKLASVNYVADQLGDFIEWAEEKFTGVKYDKDFHIGMLESDAIGQHYMNEIYHLIKQVPCPISPMDALSRFHTVGVSSRYPNMEKALEFLRVLRDELGERVASGRGPYPEERLRLLWGGQSHSLQTISPSRLLLERKVALPCTMVGATTRHFGLRGAPYGEVSEYGVKLSPLQQEASEQDIQCWGGPGKRWVNGLLDMAHDIGAHGIIHFQLVGCTPMRGMGSVVAERAEKELGIPTLNIEGRYLDPDYMTQQKFEEILAPFIDKCFDWAGKPRQ